MVDQTRAACFSKTALSLLDNGPSIGSSFTIEQCDDVSVLCGSYLLP